ncbi:MAG TPA: HlyD family efflux transporter periplasmic adaptor subunit [Gemmatimonadaceae bacterium]|nr:HlyD family efflux transporter periplasmic adaptor subunit [Gemmatimonadaceae bacterium]
MKRKTIAAIGAMLLFTACEPDESELVAHGTVEIREFDVAPTMPGRVAQVRVDEGDTVTLGDTLALLTLATLPSDIAAAEARLATALARVRDLEAGARAPELERAQAAVRAARAEAERTARDLERMEALAEAGATSRQELDAVRTAAVSAASRLDGVVEESALLEQGARPEQVRAARGEVASARAAVSAAVATASDLVLAAPASGVVLGRHADPGEVIAAGTPVITVGRSTEPWVRVFVAASVLPKLLLGDSVWVTVPGLDREVAGIISAINDRAEFTPRVALTEKERSDQLFGVKVEVRGESAMKPGMPATVRFRSAAADSSGAGRVAR